MSTTTTTINLDTALWQYMGDDPAPLVTDGFGVGHVPARTDARNAMLSIIESLARRIPEARPFLPGLTADTGRALQDIAGVTAHYGAGSDVTATMGWALHKTASALVTMRHGA